MKNKQIASQLLKIAKQIMTFKGNKSAIPDAIAAATLNGLSENNLNKIFKEYGLKGYKGHVKGTPLAGLVIEIISPEGESMIFNVTVEQKK